MQHQVYQHYSEQRILCVGDTQVDLRLCNTQSYQSLRDTGMQHIHLGMFMIRLHTLHRRGAGTTALVVLRNTRWGDERQIIGTMEVDLSAGTQLIYMLPDMVLSIDDFHNHIQVAVQTHGYDEWQDGESNLLITMGLIGRISNTSYTGFEYNVENVVDHLATTGITAIPGERGSIEDLEGRSWNLKPPSITTVRIPARVEVNHRLDRSTSLRFRTYRNNPQPRRFSVDSNDREIHDNGHVTEDEQQFIGVFTQEEVPHIPYDVCFCTSCLDDAQRMQDEPLNKAIRGNKPKKWQKRKWKNWAPLGEYSGKWDYYVHYDTPTETTPIDQIVANGWDDLEQNPWNDNTGKGKVIIKEEDLSSEEDEKEEMIKMLQLVSENCENSNQALHTAMEQNKEEDELYYPKLKEFTKFIQKTEHQAFPSTFDVTSANNPPREPVMGPPVYPPARGSVQSVYTPNYQYPKGSANFRGDYGTYHNSQWTLPPAMLGTGAMLILPSDPGRWSDVISRWESITINRLNDTS